MRSLDPRSRPPSKPGPSLWISRSDLATRVRGTGDVARPFTPGCSMAHTGAPAAACREVSLGVVTYGSNASDGLRCSCCLLAPVDHPQAAPQLVVSHRLVGLSRISSSICTAGHRRCRFLTRSSRMRSRHCSMRRPARPFIGLTSLPSPPLREDRPAQFVGRLSMAAHDDSASSSSRGRSVRCSIAELDRVMLLEHGPVTHATHVVHNPSDRCSPPTIGIWAAASHQSQCCFAALTTRRFIRLPVPRMSDVRLV